MYHSPRCLCYESHISQGYRNDDDLRLRPLQRPQVLEDAGGDPDTRRTQRGAQEKMNGVANNNSVIATTSMSRSRG